MHRTNGDSFGTGTSSHGVAGIHIYREELAGSYDATQGRHQEMNAIQEEICDVIEHEGITLHSDTETPATMTQLRAALDARHVASRVTNDSGVTGAFVDDALNTLNGGISGLDGRLDTLEGQTLDSRLSTLEGQTLDSRLDTLEGQTLDSRLNTLEGQALDSRLDTLEGQNLDSRLDAYDADTTELEGTLKMFGFTADLDVLFHAQIQRHRVNATTYVTMVSLQFLETTGTSTDQYLGFTSADIPSGLRPGLAQSLPIMVFENGSAEPICGCIRVTPTGNWTIRLYNGSNFTSSGTKGIGGQRILYQLTNVSS